MDAEVDWRSLLWRNLAWENDLDWDGNRHDQNCVGGHADGEPCDLLAQHHYQCIGFHFGYIAECVLCGHPRCTEHGYGTGDHTEFCEGVYCTGHYIDENGYVDCQIGHAFWCRNTDRSTDRKCEGYDGDTRGCTWPSGDQGEPDGLYVFTDLAEEVTTCTLDYTLETADQVSDFIADLEQAHKIMREEEAAVEAARQAIATLVESIS